MPIKWEQLMRKKKLFSMFGRCSNHIFFHFVDFLKTTHTRVSRNIELKMKSLLVFPSTPLSWKKLIYWKPTRDVEIT